MTMKRADKMTHQMELNVARQNSGYTAAEWASPAGRRQALATTGHLMMPAADYIRERMGRKVSSRDRRDVAVERRQARRGRR